MSKEYKLPELNSIQINQIIKHLKSNAGTNKKESMDEVSFQITELFMLSGYSNGECAYLLTNVMRHLLSLEKNKLMLDKLNVDIQSLDIDTLIFIQNAWSNDYRKGVDEDGNKKQ